MKNKKQIYTIEVLNVFFLYSVGEDLIAVSTRPNNQYTPLPDYVQVCFPIETPPGIYIPTGERSSDEIDAIVSRAIRAKIAEQKRTGASANTRSDKKKEKVKQENLFDDVKQ